MHFFMSYIAEDFREMDPKGDHNFCCGGGGGLNGIGLYRKERNVGLKNKLDQIKATGAELVISPCHNCWDAIRDMDALKFNVTWSADHINGDGQPKTWVDVATTNPAAPKKED